MQRFTVERTAMLTALKAAKLAKSNHSPITALANAFIKVADGEAKVQCSNLDMTITYTIKASSEGPVELLIDANSLINVLTSAKGVPVITFEADKGEVNLLNGDTILTTMAYGDPRDFPKIPAVIPTLTFGFSRRLIESLPAALSTVSVDEMRPVLTGVCLEALPNGLVMTGTDGHRLFSFYLPTDVIQAEWVDSAPEGAFIGDSEKKKDTDYVLTGAGNLPVVKGAIRTIVPAASLKALVSLTKNISPVKFCASTSHFEFTSTNWSLTGRLIDGHYPQYQGVMPTDAALTWGFNTQDMMDAIARILPATCQLNNLARFAITEGKTTISASDPDRGISASETVLTKVTGSDLTIGFSAKYFLQMLKVLPGKRVTLYATESDSGILWSSGSRGLASAVYLLMPIRMW